ncbi:UDP-N-acetylmuramyl-tripeptide synthetase [Candidatus Kaiserbacteria bacterium]|nr:UDP-N-acetylmuramyl-tripeptide synthetase [Candidatus Kaiserbacteria bacterium]
MYEIFKNFVRRVVPPAILAQFLKAYHFLFAWGATLWQGMPAKKLFVIGVTGTKGKSSTAEMMNAILEEAGYRTALASTIRFKIGVNSAPNLFKMTMPGRGFLQKFLAEARKADCTHVVLEITSEGARQFRHTGIPLDMLIFTNIAPEHIESHGSFENYKRAKLAIGHSLVHSPKRPRIVVANADDELGKEFLKLPVERALPYRLSDANPYKTLDGKVSMTVSDVTFDVPFPGEFTILNALAAADAAKEIDISAETIGRALSRMRPILGRVERIDCGQDFVAIVDYAHTPNSLRALYRAFSGRRKVCVLGNTGGGRDTWKRPEMGKIAEDACDIVILTNEDPYDEDPRAILEEMARGMEKKKSLIIMDRREAIRRALLEAHYGDAVLVTGKGTDPYIMLAKGKKLPWSDAAVVREELETLIGKGDK